MIKLAENIIGKLKAELVPKSKIWIEANDQVVFGGGRMKLFRAIEECGSIRQAATKLGMSYRAAWGKIKATEERLGMQLVEKHAGGHQSGAQLTEDARKLLGVYRQFKADSVKAVDKLFSYHFKEFLT